MQVVAALRRAIWRRQSGTKGQLIKVMHLRRVLKGQNDKAAVRWSRLATDQGDASAQDSHGILFRDGRGVPQSDVEA